jgi:hypothetical protein
MSSAVDVDLDELRDVGRETLDLHLTHDRLQDAAVGDALAPCRRSAAAPSPAGVGQIDLVEIHVQDAAVHRVDAATSRTSATRFAGRPAGRLEADQVRSFEVGHVRTRESLRSTAIGIAVLLDRRRCRDLAVRVEPARRALCRDRSRASTLSVISSMYSSRVARVRRRAS